MKHSTLAEMLKCNRTKHGWTLQEAANRLGTSKGQVHEPESGVNKNPRLSTIAKLCEVYNIAPDALIKCAESA